jgi:GNAT superfamily N-acetyltransferase
MPEILQSLEAVVVRPALASDKAAVLQFCQHTWPDIEDYIPLVWDKWMADVSGQILVAVLNERPVAMARVVRLSDIEGWWEGLRVDPQYRGRGLVSVLEQAVKQYFRELGVEVIRSCVAKWNTIMHGMMQRRGYQQVGCYLLHRADAVQAPVEQIGKLTGDDAEAAWSFLNSQDGSLRERLFVSRGARMANADNVSVTRALECRVILGLSTGRILAKPTDSELHGKC